MRDAGGAVAVRSQVPFPASPMLRLPVPAEAAGTRLDRFLAENGAVSLSRVRAQALIRDGRVQVNDRPAPKPGATLRAGDVVAFKENDVTLPPDPGAAPPAGEDIPLHILHEDADLLVLDKPPGLVVHPAAGNYTGTLVNALVHHLGGEHRLSGVGGPGRPGIVHRLDKDTSGCLVVAKNDETHRALSAQFAGRTTEKFYLALVLGVPKIAAGTIDAPIGRHPVDRKRMAVVAATGRGRSARTDWRVERMLDAGCRMLDGGISGAARSRGSGHPASSIQHPASLLSCRLHTGRTHQIRVHLAHLGHPILGDALYGGAVASRVAGRQMLHAWQLGFRHPRTGEIVRYRAPLPADFQAFGLDAPV